MKSDPQALVQAVEAAIEKLPVEVSRGTGLAETVQVAYDQILDLRDNKKRKWKTILRVLQEAEAVGAEVNEMNLRAAFAKERRWREGTLKVAGKLVKRRWGVRTGPKAVQVPVPAGVEPTVRAAAPQPGPAPGAQQRSAPTAPVAAIVEDKEMITLPDGRRAARGEMVPLKKPEDWAASDHIRYWASKGQSSKSAKPPMVRAESVEEELKRLQ